MKVELENSTRYMFKIELKSKVNARLRLFQLKFFLAIRIQQVLEYQEFNYRDPRNTRIFLMVTVE